MKIVDFNDWDYEVTNLININRNYKIKKIFCKVVYIFVYIVYVVCIGILLQTFYNITEKEKIFWICAFAFLVKKITKKFETRLKQYEIKNLVFCIIDEDTFIDAQFIRENSEVVIVFRNKFNGNVEEFFVECRICFDSNIEEDVLEIHPNTATLFLCTDGSG